MRILLLFPPQWTAAQPPYGLAQINGHLRQAGHQVQVRDLNLEVYERALSADVLQEAYRRAASQARQLRARAEAELVMGVTSPDQGWRGVKLAALDQAVARGPEWAEALGHRASAALDALRLSWGYYDPQVLLDAYESLDEALGLFSLPFHPAALERNAFQAPRHPLDLDSLQAFARSREENPCLAIFEELLPSILEAEADLVAISVGSFSQVHPALTLASLLREALPRHAARRGVPVPHLSLGGNFFGRLREALQGLPGFFRAFADSLVVGEGERPVVKLASALESRTPLPEVPSLLWLEGDEVRWSGEAPAVPMDQAAFQSLEGFPLDRYLSPERVLCLRASKGCYWGQCAFCDSYHGLSRDQMEVERLVEEVRFLQGRYGVRHFEFVDQCISPQYLRAMCTAILDAKLDMRWFCNARTEPGFTPELFSLMRKAGATMVMWGVESGSPRLLKLMRKGVSADGRMKVLRDASAAGLFNFAYVFFGFPTETELEAEQTIRLLKDHTDVIHAYGRSVFSLGKHAPLLEDPERYGIMGWVKDEEELSTNLSFQVKSGLSGKELEQVMRRCTRVCRQAYGDPLWMALGSREALHLYLAHHDRPWVEGIKFDPGTDAPAAPFAF